VVKAAADKLAPPPSNDFDSFPLLKLTMNGLNRQNLFLSVKKMRYSQRMRQQASLEKGELEAFIKGEAKQWSLEVT
jgi:hypothetical protein